MNNELVALSLILMLIFGVFIGKLVFGVYDTENTLTRMTLTRMTGAYGFDEKSNMWNRIRVDEQGHVLCHKE